MFKYCKIYEEKMEANDRSLPINTQCIYFWVLYESLTVAFFFLVKVFFLKEKKVVEENPGKHAQ